MKILIVTPLYPPDTAASGNYVKELATRLSRDTAASSSKHSLASKDEVAIVTYATHPEKIPGVEIIVTSKHHPIFLRILLFTTRIIQASRKVDVIIVENGASAELPFFFFSLFRKTPYLFHISDTAAHAHAARSSLFGHIEKLAIGNAKEVITDMPLPRPEILPFVPYPEKAFASYEASWLKHIEHLRELFKKNSMTTDSHTPDAKKLWNEYQEKERSIVGPLLAELGYALEDEQPHTMGERYLMQAVTTESGKKIILVGKRKHDGKRVIIKSTTDTNGTREIERERIRRKVLQEINFAYEVFISPEELLFIKQHGRAISIQSFIEQDSTFLARPLPEQFALALKAFKAQESTHATTYEHRSRIRKTFGSMNAKKYIQAFTGFKKKISMRLSENSDLQKTLTQSVAFLVEHSETIEQYSGFLTHTDFVPHNFRISSGNIYMLDYSSLRFGNKYEGWARFLNFMSLYNPELEKALVEYIRLNRTPEESLSLKLMRIYRLGEIIWYYTQTLDKSVGNLYELNMARVHFWTELLKSQLSNAELDPKIRKSYIELRDSLRSDDEKQRQQNLH